MANWPWQPRSVEAVRKAWRDGYRAVCLALPTGMGKGQISFDLLKPLIAAGTGRGVILSNRKMLTEQIGERAESAGIEHGYVASGFRWDQFPSLQVVSAQTARAREMLPDAELVICDEAHRADFDPLVDRYKEETNALICGLTATPIGLQHYDLLINGGTKAEGRAHGALVGCKVYAPSEPDIKGIRRETKAVRDGEQLFNLVQHHVFADILEHWQKIQDMHRKDFPRGCPTLLWAPGVPESRWFAGAFAAAGIPAAHIDGTTDKETRKRIREEHKAGVLKIVCSMGVLREGVDWPWAAHGILVQTCGELLTYLQLVGRILRASRGKPYAIFQDHSGAWWRHGSPNRDIEWELGETESSAAAKLSPPKPKMGDAESQPEGIVCPMCRAVRQQGPTCPQCGYAHTKSMRKVMTEDGALVSMEGSPNYEPPPQPKEDAKVWISCLFRCGKTGKTMGQAAALFHQEMRRWPGRDLRYVVDRSSVDWDRRVADVLPWTNKKETKSAQS